MVRRHLRHLFCRRASVGRHGHKDIFNLAPLQDLPCGGSTKRGGAVEQRWADHNVERDHAQKSGTKQADDGPQPVVKAYCKRQTSTAHIAGDLQRGRTQLVSTRDALAVFSS